MSRAAKCGLSRLCRITSKCILLMPMGHTTLSAKKLWQNDEYRQRVIDATAAGKATEESRLKRSEATRELWTDSAYRETVSAKISESLTFTDADKVLKRCSTCGKEWYVLPCRSDAAFCSRSCAMRNRRLGDKRCEACDESFRPKSASQKCCKTCVPTHQAGERWRLFSLTQQAYDAILLRQRGLCVICDCDLKTLPQRQVHLDHCHASNRVRGILCQRCNTWVGVLESRQTDLQRTLEYLQ